MAQRDWETDGMRNGKPIFCPVNGYDCPYCDKNLHCHVADPLRDCDDFDCFFESWEEYDSCDEGDIEVICPDEDKPSSIATRLTSPLLSRLP